MIVHCNVNKPVPYGSVLRREVLEQSKEQSQRGMERERFLVDSSRREQASSAELYSSRQY